MNAYRLHIIRQKRANKVKKIEDQRREKIKQQIKQQIKKTAPVVDETKWNIFYVLLKKEIEKNKYASHFILLLNDTNTVYSSSGYKFHLIKKFNENIFAS